MRDIRRVGYPRIFHSSSPNSSSSLWFRPVNRAFRDENIWYITNMITMDEQRDLWKIIDVICSTYKQQMRKLTTNKHKMFSILSSHSKSSNLIGFCYMPVIRTKHLIDIIHREVKLGNRVNTFSTYRSSFRLYESTLNEQGKMEVRQHRSFNKRNPRRLIHWSLNRVTHSLTVTDFHFGKEILNSFKSWDIYQVKNLKIIETLIQRV